MEIGLRSWLAASSIGAVLRRHAKALVVGLVAPVLCASLLIALEPPSKPFLDKNSFLLSSAGFRVQVANDAAGKKALDALPPHRFVIHRNGGDVRYLYAEPVHCVCIFIGTRHQTMTPRARKSKAQVRSHSARPSPSMSL